MKFEWIDIKKQLPPTKTDILVWDESVMDVRIMSCEDEDDSEYLRWFDCNGYFNDSEPEITHWMKLPRKPND